MCISVYCRTFIGYVIVGAVGAICALPCLFIALLPGRYRYDNRIYYWFVALFYHAVCFATFLSIKVYGREHLAGDPVILVANHQSSLDIPVLGSLIGTHPHIWLFISKWTKVPLFGFVLRRMNVVVDPSGIKKLARSLQESVDLIQNENRHLMIFPEGGRFTDGAIHHFFYGFALIAKKTKRPVVPVLLKGLNKAYPPGSILLRPHPITVFIGEPMVFDAQESEEQFLQRVHAWFVTKNEERLS